jgi:hypothetical protein
MLIRRRKRTVAESAQFPRWVVAAGVVIIGFMLLLARLSDSSGNLTRPGRGSVLYMAALIWRRRTRDPSRTKATRGAKRSLAIA